MAEINTMTKSYLGEKGLFGLHIPIHSLLRETEVGTAAETMEEPLLLVACSAFFSYTAQGYLPSSGTAHNELGPPISITNQ